MVACRVILIRWNMRHRSASADGSNPRWRLHGLVVLTPAIVMLIGLEFALEPPKPNNGYMLDDNTRRALGMLIAAMVVGWAMLFVNILRWWLRRGSEKLDGLSIGEEPA